MRFFFYLPIKPSEVLIKFLKPGVRPVERFFEKYFKPLLRLRFFEIMRKPILRPVEFYRIFFDDDMRLMRLIDLVILKP